MKRIFLVLSFCLLSLTGCMTPKYGENLDWYKPLTSAQYKADKALAKAVALQIIVESTYTYYGKKSVIDLPKEVRDSLLPAMENEDFFYLIQTETKSEDSDGVTTTRVVTSRIRLLTEQELLEKMRDYEKDAIFTSDGVKDIVSKKILSGYNTSYYHVVYLRLLQDELR